MTTKFLSGYSFNDFIKLIDDEGYKFVLNKLKDDLEIAENIEEKERIFDGFADKYTIIPYLWEARCLGPFTPQNTHTYEFMIRAFNHFYSASVYDIISEYYNIFEKPMPFNNGIWFREFEKINHYDFVKQEKFSKNYIQNFKYPERILTYPHFLLSHAYDEYDKYGDRSIPEEIIQKYKKATLFMEEYEKEDPENPNWQNHIKLIFEWGDDKFAIQSMEAELAQYVFDKNLWKLYINEMRNRNLRIMLNIYYRYTRLFLSDIEMQKEYEIEKQKVVMNNNDTDFEELPTLDSYFFNEPISERAPYIFNKYVGSPYENGKHQNFSIPNPIIDEVLNSSNAKLRQKLFNSCKALFQLKPTSICHYLHISPDIKVSEFSYQSLKLKSNGKPQEIMALKNLFVSNHLGVNNIENSYLLSKLIIPKLYKCCVRFISIFGQNINFKDYKFLVEDSNKLEIFVFHHGGILESENGNLGSIESILSKIPNTPWIEIMFDPKNLTLKPTNLLSTLEHRVKLKRCYLGHFNEIINFDDYCNFIKKNGEYRSRFEIFYTKNVLDKEMDDFDEKITKIFNENNIDFEECPHAYSMIDTSK